MKPLLSAVSLGPGDETLLSPAARNTLEAADVIVGYTAYMNLVDPELIAKKETFATGMMGEVERIKKAIEYAQSGKRTAVVCSGDAGIYAMAGLLIEVLEAENLLDAIDFEVVPGIPAFNAAAALLGAPLMHDFAAISLSDLLTPIEQIEKRLHCAADGDFVIAIYNPRSKKRHEHLQRALDIIQKFRGPQTPIGMVRNAYRPEQEIIIDTLENFDPTQVDMLSVLIIGNSTTRIVGKKMLTPRGYHKKYSLNADG